MPKTRSDYWRGKIENNRLRDLRATCALEDADWRIMVLWECEIVETADLALRLTEFLSPPKGVSATTQSRHKRISEAVDR